MHLFESGALKFIVLSSSFRLCDVITFYKTFTQLHLNCHFLESKLSLKWDSGRCPVCLQSLSSDWLMDQSELRRLCDVIKIRNERSPNQNCNENFTSEVIEFKRFKNQ